MRRTPALGLATALAVAFVAAAVGLAPRTPAAGPKLAHMVFFTLKDRSDASRQRFVDSCHKYLSGHEGASYFSIGTIAEDVEEPVSVRDFDVALHLVFDDKAAADRYQKSDRHQQFVRDNRDVWSKVRVFDTYLTEP